MGRKNQPYEKWELQYILAMCKYVQRQWVGKMGMLRKRGAKRLLWLKCSKSGAWNKTEESSYADKSLGIIFKGHSKELKF